MIKKIYALLVLLYLITTYSFNLQAQTQYRFSLEEALAFAYENNYEILSSYKDIEAAEKQVKEYMAIGFPQVNANITYTDYLELPTMIIPPGSFGPDVPGQEIQFGTKFNATASATASQMIFDGKYIVGLQASQRLLEKNQQQFIKTRLDMYEAVSAAYYRILVAEDTKVILDSTMNYMQTMLYETRVTFEAGFVEETDVDQLELIVADLEANIILTNTQVEIAYAYLKFLCGLMIDDNVEVTDQLDDLIAKVNHSALLNNS